MKNSARHTHGQRPLSFPAAGRASCRPSLPVPWWETRACGICLIVATVAAFAFLGWTVAQEFRELDPRPSPPIPAPTPRPTPSLQFHLQPNEPQMRRDIGLTISI